MNVIRHAAAAPTGAARPPAMRATARGRHPARGAQLGADGVPATVAAVEYLGADTLIETRIAISPSSCAGRPRDVGAGELSHPLGPAAAHWFDLSSQRRIDR
jgi:sn-glycerol 3-phosphate transport system ATP-binding protein